MELLVYGCSRCGLWHSSPNGKPLGGKCGIRRGAWEGGELRVCEGIIVPIGYVPVRPMTPQERRNEDY